MSPPRVEIVVDELVMRGLRPEAARVAAAALQARLEALAARPGAAVPARAEASRVLPAVSAPAHSPAVLGERVATAVWGAVSGGARR